MGIPLIDLPWLPEPPEDFRHQVRNLSAYRSEFTQVAQHLSGYRLMDSRLHNLGTVINRLTAQDAGAVRCAILSNGTVDLLVPALAVSALRHGVPAHIIGTTFNQVATEALDPTSAINRARCQYVLLCLDHRGLGLTPAPGNPDLARTTIDDAIGYVDSICHGLREVSATTIIVQTVPQVASSLFGSLERSIPGTLQWLIEHYNHELRTRMKASPDLLLDAAALAETVGLVHWHDSVQWALGKFPFAHSVVPLYAEWVGRLMAAARGKTRKCLVLDLDNTLWGGVIGDDGLSGITLGNGNPVGEAYLSVQQTALALRERGIILAVSSKNDDGVARNAFRTHPEMLLKEEHIAVFQANWQDKASNMQAIAKTLNIGVDALVLLDDNPSERAQVRASLPDVAVPELPPDPTLYPETLLAAGYFEATAYTAEDRLRATQYQANAARSELLGTATDLNSYLRSLQMRAVFSAFDAVGRSRITQLINKTNQFNLTTHRYTESQIQAFEKSDSGLTVQARLIDRFGDNGMIAVVICVEDGAAWIIDTWLMSCRVLNRMVEQATLNHLVARAKLAGIQTLIGNYFRTARNGIVKDHYSRLGFEPLFVKEDSSRWKLEVASYSAISAPIALLIREPETGQAQSSELRLDGL